MERSRLIPCPVNKETPVWCKYAPNCHTSEHHIFPRRTADTPVKKKFGNLAINKVISCRMIHDILDSFPPPEYPVPKDMRETITKNKGWGDGEAV